MTRKTEQNITTVSLLETWEIKQNMMREGGNFSRFVRNCLREWARYEQEIVCMRETTPRELLCFPRDSRLCVKCWPDGPPPKWSWLDYMGQTDEGEYYNHDQPTAHRNDEAWVQAQAAEFNAAGSDQWTVEGLSWRGRPPRAKPKVKRGFRARFKGLLSNLRKLGLQP